MDTIPDKDEVASSTLAGPIEVNSGEIRAEITSAPAARHVAEKPEKHTNIGLTGSGSGCGDSRPPAAIAEIEGLQQIILRGASSGIYFLCDEGEVVYVGQSWTVISRVVCHITENLKTFDSAFFLPCHRDHLDLLEQKFIGELVPKYNQDPEARRARRSRRVSPKRLILPPAPKSCPHCAAACEIVSYPIPERNRRGYSAYVQCTGCRCRSDDWEDYFKDNAELKAVRVWNLRTDGPEKLGKPFAGREPLDWALSPSPAAKGGVSL